TAGSDLAELNRLWHEGGPGATAGGVTLPPRGGSLEPGSAPVAPRVNPLAIISLALNLICGVGNIAAIVVGVAALRQIRRSNGSLGGKGQAIGGIALGALGFLGSVLAFFWLFGRGDG